MNTKKLVANLKKVLVIMLLLWAIYVMIEIFRIKNNLSRSPLIIVKERSTPNDFTYYSLGFKTEYIYKDGKKDHVTFKFMNIITIWDEKYES